MPEFKQPDERLERIKKRLKTVNFRLEPELYEKLSKFDNKSYLIREAIKEKLGLG